MSFNVETLKSASDDNVPSFLRTPEAGTTSAIRHNTIFEFGKLGKGARVTNNDSLNNLTVRLHNPNATAQIVPPNSDFIVNEWFAEIHVEPDAVTGDFQVTIEVATLKDALK